jgi:uncharacterized membrane protein (UPF0127 family)
MAASCSDGDETATPTTGSPTTKAGVVTTAAAGGTTMPPVATPAVTATPVSTSTPPPVTAARSVPDVLAPFELGTVALDGRELTVAIADESRLRSRGLMHVEDLGPLDGMIFVWGDDTDESFWMRDTLIALDIAWFSAHGAFVSQLMMVPCPSGEVCPTYDAAGAYRFALEMPAGTMGELGEDSRLVVPEEIAGRS